MNNSQLSSDLASGIPNTFGREFRVPWYPIRVREIYDTPLQHKDNKWDDEEEMKRLINLPIKKSTRLEDMSNELNRERFKAAEKSTTSNMSLKDISYKVSDSFTGLIDDLLTFNWKTGNFTEIFFKEDRLMYIGITIVIFSFIIMLIRTTDTPQMIIPSIPIKIEAILRQE